MGAYKWIVILGCLLAAFYTNSETLALSQRTISETNEPSFELDYIKNFKRGLSQPELAWLARRDTIVVGIVKPFTPPFEILTSEKRLEGIGADILSVLAKLTGKSISIQVYKSQRQVLDAVKNNKVDMLNIASLPAGVSMDSIGEHSINIMLDNCAYLAGIKPVSTNLSKPKIAYELGGVNEHTLTTAYPKAMLMPFESIMDAYDAVYFGKADAVIGSISSLTYLNNTRLHGLPLQERTGIKCTPLSFFISGHHSPLKKIIDKLVANMQTSSLMGMTALRWSGGSYKSMRSFLHKLGPAAQAWLTSEPVVRVGLIRDDFPYSFIDASGQWQGIIVDVLNNIRYSSGLSFEPSVFNNATELNSAVLSGKIDLIGNTLPHIYA